MTAYGLGVESPSVAGLKMDIDRLKDEVNVFLREAKKGAEEYIVHVKEMRAAAEKALAKIDEEEAEDEDEGEGQDEDEGEGEEKQKPQ
jgi:ribosome recycling factor